MAASDTESALERLVALEEIRSLALRYCRAVDRRDFEALRDLYHDDATDDHGGMFVGPASEFIDKLPELTAPMDTTSHYIGNHSVALDGDRAEGEVYTIAYHRLRDADGAWIDMIAGGRYLDRYARRRDRRWRFASRKIVMDWNSIRPSQCDWEADMLEGVSRGAIREADPSFELLALLRLIR